jgi:predicted dehydrogenase
MSKGTLRAALIGAGGFGTHALQALRGSRLVELAGLSDRDPRVAEAAAAEAACPGYTDHRRLLAETAAQAVFLAVPPGPAIELVRLAAQRGVHVWRQVPVARSLPEAVELCQLMDRCGRKFAVGTQRRFMSGYRRARDMLDRLGEVYLTQAHYQFDFGPSLGWRGDRSAGGGALVELGYHMFDLLLWLLGLPETVYTIAGTGQRAPGREDLPVYDSDDTAVAVFRCAGKAATTVTVSRCFRPVSEGVTLYGAAGVLSAGPEQCELRDRQGTVLESFRQEETLAVVFTRMIDSFARAAAEDAARYECSGWENLPAMAAVDAAYLSDQTGQPESPGELLAHYNVTAHDTSKCTPTEDVRP